MKHFKVAQTVTRTKDYEEIATKKDTPLHIVVKNNCPDQIEIINLLIKSPFIDLKVEDKDGKKPYDCTDNPIIKNLPE